MATETGKDGRPIVAFASQREWEDWLEAEHAASEGVWLKLAKKNSRVETVSFDEALESALCYGWIDSQAASLDERFYLQRFTPRRKRSRWSRINRDRVAELTKQGRMKPAGLAQVELARADGRWDAAYDSPATATVPDDLRRALDANPKARDFFATLSSQNRYAILYQLQDAKKPETRARRLEKFVALLNEQKKIY